MGIWEITADFVAANSFRPAQSGQRSQKPKGSQFLRPQKIDMIYRFALTQLPTAKFGRRVEEILSSQLTLLK